MSDGAGQDADLYHLASLLAPRLLGQVARRGGLGTRALSLVAYALRGWAWLRRAPAARWPRRRGPDSVWVVGGWLPHGVRAMTFGNWVVLGTEESPADERMTLIHEYVHVLQYRAEGLFFLWRYWRAGLRRWDTNPYEVQAMAVEALYRANPALPPPWELGGARFL